MNLNQLEYFISVAESLNFTKAAEKNYISQTAISQQIHALEQAVGVPLFIRDKHHVELTPAGEVYLREAKAILERSNEAIRLARTASAGLSGNITIGMIRGCINENFAQLFRAFHSAYPNVSIHFIRDNMNGLKEALENDHCDIIFNLAASIGHSAVDYQHRFISSYALTAAVPEGHRLSDRKYIMYSELEGEKFIIMQPSGRPKDDAEEVLVAYERGGFIPEIVASEREPELLLLMVSAGIGISVLPEYVIRSHTLGRNIKVLPIIKPDGTPEMLDLEVCWKDSRINSAARRFLDTLAEMTFSAI